MFETRTSCASHHEADQVLRRGGFALSAVRDWEQGRRRPERSARILLKIVQKEPKAMTCALAS
ncbi:MAG: hypothetical protein HYX37_18470 [Rhizobiales bacterium]|nr:hypothetical protein [Hyphomicrobiales bacterium]